MAKKRYGTLGAAVTLCSLSQDHLPGHWTPARAWGPGSLPRLKDTAATFPFAGPASSRAECALETHGHTQTLGHTQDTSSAAHTMPRTRHCSQQHPQTGPTLTNATFPPPLGWQRHVSGAGTCTDSGCRSTRMFPAPLSAKCLPRVPALEPPCWLVPLVVATKASSHRPSTLTVLPG